MSRRSYENGKSVTISLYDVAYDAIRAIPGLPESVLDKYIEDAIGKITDEIVAQIDANMSDIGSDLGQEIIK